MWEDCRKTSSTEEVEMVHEFLDRHGIKRKESSGELNLFARLSDLEGQINGIRDAGKEKHKKIAIVLTILDAQGIPRERDGLFLSLEERLNDFVSRVNYLKGEVNEEYKEISSSHDLLDLQGIKREEGGKEGEKVCST